MGVSYFQVMVACLKFFLGRDSDEKDSDESDSENEINPKDVMIANKINKKTRKREKHLDKVKKLAVKAKKKKSQAPIFNFSALHLIHDPQGKRHIFSSNYTIILIIFLL